MLPIVVGKLGDSRAVSMSAMATPGFKRTERIPDLVGGDTVAVYAAEFGFLAAGVVPPTTRPREVDKAETGLITGIDHPRNWIAVEWRFGHADASQAVKKLLDSGLIPALSVSPVIDQPEVPA